LIFRFTDFEIDIARHELRHAGAIVHIEPQVFDLLVHLVRNRERIVSKDELIETVWQGRIVSEATLSSRIAAARRALGDSGNDQSFIRTLYNRGFRFVGDVADDGPAPAAISSEVGPLLATAAQDAAKLVPNGDPPPLRDRSLIAGLSLEALTRPPEREFAAEGLAVAVALPPALSDLASGDGARDAVSPSDHRADPAPGEMPAEDAKASSGSWTGSWATRNLPYALAMVAFASSVVTSAWWLLSTPSSSATASPKDPVALASTAESSAGRLKAPLPSIVVVPFVNRSGDAKQDYVADGISDSIISDLVHALPGISVVSRDTAFTYKGHGADAQQIGRELEVRYLLEGSVVPEGERVRVNARLIETRDGSQLWAERFDTERTSILQVQDEIVGRVLRAIGLKVVDHEARRSLRERPSSAEVVDLIMRGKALLNLPSSSATMIEARGLFEQALKMQPASVDGLTGVAATLVFEFLNGYYETGGNERLQRAEALLDRAVLIEPRHLMALKTKAALRRTQGKFDDAIAAAEAIITENPGEPWAYKEIGLSTLYLGRPEQALDWFAKADRIGPRDPGRWTWLDGRGHALILLGRDEEAIHALIAALDANPRNLSSRAFLAAAYALLDRADEARAELAAYLQGYPGVRISKFRRLSPVPLVLASSQYQQQYERLKQGLRQAGMLE
jgi:TolB-like protein/DNA-binding winged helix-turn-helix (wHTH) protein/cytochrome c-type biogenesis protein CcmH/NrfG